MGWSITSADPEGQAFATVLVVFAVVAIVAFGLRMLSRRIQKASLDASDYACLLGLILDIGLTVIFWAAFANGWGQTISQFTLEDAQIAAKIFIAVEIVWNSATVSVRVSMLLFYMRIFAVRRFRMICWIIAAFNIASLIAVIFSICLICRPYSYSFLKTGDGYCGNLINTYTAVWNLIADTVIVVLPMPMLWGLQLQTKKQVGLSIVFGVGAITCILTLTRVITSVWYEQDDYTKQAALTALFTGLEPILGVINACLPFMPLVFKHFLQPNPFAGSTRFINIFSKSNPKAASSTTATRMKRINHSGQFNELRDIEMDPFHSKSEGKSFVGTGSPGGLAKGGSLNGFNVPNRIFVRRDYTVERESS